MRKILYLHQYFKFPTERGGTRSYDLATSFVKKGYKVIVVSSSKDKEFKSKRWNVVKKDGLEVHFMYSSYGTQLSYLKRSFVFLRFMIFASIHLLRINADVVLATSTPLTIGIPAMIKKWFHNTPYIFEVRDVWPEAVIAIGAVKNRFLQKWLYFQENIIYRNADYIVPLSTDMQKSIISRYPQYKKKVNIVIENIAEVNRFKKNDNFVRLHEIIGFQPRFTILYAGTFGKVNGLSYVVELAKQTLLLDSSIVFVLIGAGGERENIEKIAKNEKVLNKNLFLLPPVSKDELPLWYKSIDIGSSFVIDVEELWANSANKFFDSLAAGKPILINHPGWQADIINENNIGFVLPQVLNKKSVESFIAYTRNKELLNLQRVEAYKTAVSLYSLEKATEKYINIFNNI